MPLKKLVCGKCPTIKEGLVKEKTLLLFPQRAPSAQTAFFVLSSLSLSLSLSLHLQDLIHWVKRVTVKSMQDNLLSLSLSLIASVATHACLSHTSADVF